MSETRSAPDLAADLIARAQRASETRGLPAATAFDRISAELSRWLGVGGSHALLARALLQASASHPSVSGIGLVAGSTPRLDRLTEGLDAHGAAAIGAGLEAALIALLELMERLIGNDLSLKLAELSMTTVLPDAAKSEGERAPQR